MGNFELVSPYSPCGDQPAAIEKLSDGLADHAKRQCLLGVTGSGKTFTMANVVARLNRPTLVISHNKTLAAQLYEEFRDLFPNNAVEYFVSYYDYYQPEAMAQLAGVLLLRRIENINKIAYILSIDNVKFRRSVVPGDQLILEAELKKLKTRTGQVQTKASVEGAVVAEASIRFMIVDAY